MGGAALAWVLVDEFEYIEMELGRCGCVGNNTEAGKEGCVEGMEMLALGIESAE